MQPLTTLFIGLACIMAALIVVWVIQCFTRNAGLVDPVWSAALGLLGVLYAVLGDVPPMIRLLLALMAGLWGLRLAGHLALRMRGQPEDSRYAGARAAWGRRANLYMLGFFVFQGVVGWILSLPFLVLAYRPEVPAWPLIVIAVGIWFLSVGGEAVADYQLQRFKSDPRNRGGVCNTGLWRYSRHPNYFFESMHWVSYVVLAMGAPYWWVTLAGPVLMATLLLKVSGIPTIENKPAQTHRTGYAEYVRTTSAFIPWPPRNHGD